MEFSEEEIYSLALEGNEDAKNILYEKYKFIVSIILKKYYRYAKDLNVDVSELEQEAYLALSDALNSYRDDKKASISTFVSMVVERRIQKVLKSLSTDKAKFLNNVYSLDYEFDEYGNSLIDVISDSKLDPLNNLTNKENYEELMDYVNKNLSVQELEVFNYYIKGIDYITIAKELNKNPKQIDNTIQRIKNKIRDINFE